MEMDEIDRRLLQLIQDAFPLVNRPWAALGREVGISKEEVLARTRRLVRVGIIKRVGPILDARKIGLAASSLIAMRVPPPSLERVAKKVSAFKEVTHNYEREHDYNLWFTVVTKDSKSLSKTLEAIKRATGVEDLVSLPRSRAFKIKVHFRFTTETMGRKPTQKSKELVEISREERKLLKVVQDGIQIVSRPFAKVADVMGKSERYVLCSIGSLIEKGVIRRFGAVIGHRAAGFRANAMVAWKVPAEIVRDIGEKIAQFEEVTHCYERLTVPGRWEYNVFCVIHGRNRDECEGVIKCISKEIGIDDYVVLYSKREFKSSSVRI